MNRLTLIARGIGDPLVSAYARCYLCRVGIMLSQATPYLRHNFDDILSVYQTVSGGPLQDPLLNLPISPEFQIFTGGVRSEIARQKLTISTYVSLYAPALDWILACIAVGAEDFALDEIVLRCQEKKNCAMLFHSILGSFPRHFIAVRAMHFANILCKCDTEGYSRAELLRGLGQCLTDTPPTPNQLFDVFEYTWKTVQTFTQIGEYVHCMEAWAPYVAGNLTVIKSINFHYKNLSTSFSL